MEANGQQLNKTSADPTPKNQGALCSLWCQSSTVALAEKEKQLQGFCDQISRWEELALWYSKLSCHLGCLHSIPSV